ncbi:MAG: thioesterase [Cycloclasticus sp. symbiont of Poecilosclerida sp. N]|nr:MAG: thioesterase [Cycloclasticus sp. symbiont of Poecilosclerida sp. N]
MSKQFFTHSFLLQVRWGDADALGHINNVQFVRYLESARVAYCDDVLDVSFKPAMMSGWILADMQCSYLQQVHYPAQLEIYTRIGKIGNKSATISADIYCEDEPVMRSQSIMVWFDYAQQKTVSVPDAVRAKIAAFEKSVEGL